MWGAQVLPLTPKSRTSRDQEKNRPNCGCGEGELLNRPQWDKQQREVDNIPSLPCQMPRDELAKDQNTGMKLEQRSNRRDSSPPNHRKLAPTWITCQPLISGGLALTALLGLRLKSALYRKAQGPGTCPFPRA